MATFAADIDQLVLEGVKLQSAGASDSAREIYSEVLRQQPENAAALYSLAAIALNAGDTNKGLELAQRCVGVAGTSPLAWYIQGVALKASQNLHGALQNFDHALSLDPNYIEALSEQASIRLAHGNFGEARTSLERILTLDPANAFAQAAQASLGKAAAALNVSVDQLTEKGLALQNAGDVLAARSVFLSALEVDGQNFVALYSLAAISLNGGEAAAGLQYAERCLAIDSSSAFGWYIAGCALKAGRRFAEAHEHFDAALEQNPDYKEARFEKGITYGEAKDYVSALIQFNEVLQLDPDHRLALVNLATSLTILKRDDEASLLFSRLLAIDPDHDYVLGALTHARLHSCNWTDFEPNRQWIIEAVREGKRACKPLAFLALSDSPADQLICARTFSEQAYPLQKEQLWAGERYQHQPLRIGYVSPDLREHPVGHLTAGVFEHHDKGEFEIYAFSLGIDDHSSLRQRFKAASDHFVDVRGKTSREIAQLIRSLEIDLLIDLAGPTMDAQPDIFAFRPAPLQVSYLGYPGTSGAPYYDYIIADPVVIPEADQRHYSEKVVYLPGCYLPTDSKLTIAERTPTREEMNLPAEGFVFCSFNHDYKINPDCFGSWMRILARVPASVLWLMKLNSAAESNLRDEAARHGIDPSRLIFATRVPSIGDHLARYRLAGLFLDTHPYNAHTTATDALRAGLPVLTLTGYSFQSRVATSILRSIGMPQLSKQTPAEYEDFAVELATQPEKLAAIKAELAERTKNALLYNSASMAQALEEVYRSIISQEKAIEAPAPVVSSSSLDQIIPAEIKGDAFHRELQRLAKLSEVRTILEIGSSAGGGSTNAFVSALRDRPDPADLYCMEVSGARFAQLRDTYQSDPFVHCYNVSSVSLNHFPSRETVARFYDNIPSALRAYSKETVLGWLDADIDYVASHGFDANGIQQIRTERGIDCFDLVLIDGSEFTGEAELRDLYGARYIALDDINAYKNWTNYFRLKSDPLYELILEDRSVRNGFCVFKRVHLQKELPVDFFTIVLNGMPFIRRQVEMMKALPFQWHWHIIEGVAELKNDTAWSVATGGRIPDEMHLFGRSTDGTTEYLNELAQQLPEQVTLYRKPAGTFWNGKLEMINAPLANIRHECLLWELDVDEFWTREQVAKARELFLADDSLSAAYYWCHFFVGRDIAVSTRNCYSQNPQMEWLRTWHYHPNCNWVAHEPPRLAALQADGSWADLASVQPLLHAATEAAGLVFQHYAYTTEPQLRFKEQYYGYRDAVAGWQRLQTNEAYPCKLRDYFPWVQDGTLVDRCERIGTSPLADFDAGSGDPGQRSEPEPDIIIDAVFFQYYNTGIARVWRSLLNEWKGTSFGQRLLILNRGGKAPRIDGLRYLDFPVHDYANLERDQRLIQSVCDRFGASVFLSTYYTSPVSTPSVLLVHDMIPEALGADLQHPMWVEKAEAVRKAAAHVCVSGHTAHDLLRFHPELPPEAISVAHNGVSLRPPTAERIAGFRAKYHLDRPYFLLSGARGSYKNSILFFRGFAELSDERGEYAIVCTGPNEGLQPEFAELAGPAPVFLLDLSDDELECAYAGAVALVYPSLYEGFGMPVIEAMACGTPVITCPSGPMPEVAGDAAIYVPGGDAVAMKAALIQVQEPGTRTELIARGAERAHAFSWKHMADHLQRVITDSTAKRSQPAAA